MTDLTERTAAIVARNATATDVDADDISTAALTLRDRLPAQALIELCVEQRRATPDRTRVQRLFGVRPLRADARSWYLGVLGELRVARELAGLGPEWTVLHSVPVGDRGSDIDHVVIGPTGMFTINSKFHERQRVWVGGGTLKVGGYPTQHLRNSLHEGERATALMSRAAGEVVEVTPLVVIVAAESITFGSKRPVVSVTSVARLRGLLRRSRSRLDWEQCQYLGAVAERPSTWSTRPLVATSPTLSAEFERLQREMSSASLVRMSWALGLLVAAGLASATLIVQTLQG
jgi:hypothetical protein